MKMVKTVIYRGCQCMCVCVSVCPDVFPCSHQRKPGFHQILQKNTHTQWGLKRCLTTGCSHRETGNGCSFIVCVYAWVCVQSFLPAAAPSWTDTSLFPDRDQMISSVPHVSLLFIYLPKHHHSHHYLSCNLWWPGGSFTAASTLLDIIELSYYILKCVSLSGLLSSILTHNTKHEVIACLSIYNLI